MHVLIVKTSSLGDLVHTLPAVNDAVAALPGLRFDWLAEKPFAEIPGWHPAVDRVINCNLRGWRKHPWQVWRSGEWAAFTKELRAREYDLVIDAQSLVKSAWLAAKALGPLAGPDRHSAREPLAAWFYQRRLALPPRETMHAVERTRLLFAKALDYSVPDSPATFGLDRTRFARPDQPQPYVVFLHATTWPTKCWPEADWQALGRWLGAQGLRVLLPWGNPAEQAAAQRIAAGCDGIVLSKLRLGEVAGVLAHARAVVGVDTGLAHVAAAVDTPCVTLYGPTLPGLTGTVGRHQVHLCSTEATRVDRERPTTVAVARVQDALAPLLAG